MTDENGRLIPGTRLLHQDEIRAFMRVIFGSGFVAPERVGATGKATAPGVGDLLYATWGYERTNVDFFQVIAVRKSSVWIRKIAAHCVKHSRHDSLVVPAPDRFVDQNEHGKMRRIGRGFANVAYKVVVDSSTKNWAIPWDGEPVHQSPSDMGH